MIKCASPWLRIMSRVSPSPLDSCYQPSAYRCYTLCTGPGKVLTLSIIYIIIIMRLIKSWDSIKVCFIPKMVSSHVRIQRSGPLLTFLYPHTSMSRKLHDTLHVILPGDKTMFNGICTSSQFQWEIWGQRLPLCPMMNDIVSIYFCFTCNISEISVKLRSLHYDILCESPSTTNIWFTIVQNIKLY